MTVAEIEDYVRPPSLYRYRSLRPLDREIEAIEQSYVFCAQYGTLNDPMEGQFSSSHRLRESDEYRSVRKAIIDHKLDIGMCSFSEVHNHELMWAHYANNFKGICIAYNLPKLLNNLGSDATFVRMFYNEQEPTVRLTKKPTLELAKMVLSYKNYRWLYEREWRMLAPLGEAHYKNVNCVTHVYLGSRIADDDKHEIKRRLSRLHIRTSQMIIKKYSISFEAGHGA